MTAPLAGVRVVVTRAEHQAGELVEALGGAGAEVALLPLLDVVPPADPAPLAAAARDVAAYDWLVFTSANAVRPFFDHLAVGLPAQLRIAVVGAATAATVEAQGHHPELVATRSEAAGLVAELAPRLTPGSRVLVPQAADARPQLVEGLRRAGAEVTAVVAYDKALPDAARATAHRLFAGRPLGWVTFTSPRIVRHFVEVIGTAWETRRGELAALSVGPVTSAELRRWGVEPAAEAAQPGAPGMVAALRAALAAGGASDGR